MNQNFPYSRKCVSYIAEQWFLDHKEAIEEYNIEIDDIDVLIYYKSFLKRRFYIDDTRVTMEHSEDVQND